MMTFNRAGEGSVCVQVHAEGQGRDGGAGCGLSMGRCGASIHSRLAYRWRFSARLLELKGGKTRWHLHSERQGGSGSPPYSGILQLNFGETRVVDQVQPAGQKPQGSCYGGITLLLEAVPGDSGLKISAGQQGKLTLRLMEQGRLQSEESLPLALVEGEEIPFALQPSWLPISGLRFGEEPAGLWLYVGGSLRLWERRGRTFAAFDLDSSLRLSEVGVQTFRSGLFQGQYEYAAGESLEVAVRVSQGGMDLSLRSATEQRMLQAKRDLTQPLAPGVTGSDEKGYKLDRKIFLKGKSVTLTLSTP